MECVTGTHHGTRRSLPSTVILGVPESQAQPPSSIPRELPGGEEFQNVAVGLRILVGVPGVCYGERTRKRKAKRNEKPANRTTEPIKIPAAAAAEEEEEDVLERLRDQAGASRLEPAPGSVRLTKFSLFFVC